MTYALSLLIALQAPAEIRTGKGLLTSTISGKEMKLHTYRPVRFHENGPIIFVFHGMLRNAAEYRDDACKLGDRFGALIVCPEFDLARFTNTAYNRGGIVKADGSYARESEWTYSLLPGMITAVKQSCSSPNSPVKLVGHSAGGQFLARLVPFMRLPVDRIVISNPSSWVFPSTEQKFPYGLGDTPDWLRKDELLKSYVEQPITIFLGGSDDHQDGSMDESKQANVQGPHRLARGRAIFESATKLAKTRGWKFGWQLVEAPGIGHDHAGMFNSPAATEAIFPFGTR